MKSLLIRLMPAALLCLALTACGGGGAVGQTPYDPETAAQALLDSGAFSDALDTVDQDTAAALYGIDADTITGSAVYTSLSAGAEEIAVLVLTDEDAAAAALDGLEARVADQKAVLESYQPDEVSKLDSAIVEQRGNSTILWLTRRNFTAWRTAMSKTGMRRWTWCRRALSRLWPSRIHCAGRSISKPGFTASCSTRV